MFLLSAQQNGKQLLLQLLRVMLLLVLLLMGLLSDLLLMGLLPFVLLTAGGIVRPVQ